MSGSRWKPLAEDLPEQARELAQRLRAALDGAGLSLRRLAADDEVHHSVTALQRFFAGQALPPRQLVDLLARRCGAHGAGLRELYERVRADVVEAVPVVNPEPGPGGERRRSRVPRRRTLARIAAAIVIFIAGIVTGAQLVPAADRPSERNVAPASDNAPAGTQLLKNGGFADGTASWWGNDGKNNKKPTSIAVTSGRLVASAPGPSEKSHDRMVGQTGFSVIKGRRYILRFDGASSCGERVINVMVQREARPFEEAFDTKVNLHADIREFLVGFTALATIDKASFNFQLGGYADDCVFTFDSVFLAERLT